MPTNRTPLRRGRRLSPGRIKSLLMGPDEVLIAGAGYYNCGCSQVYNLSSAEISAAEAEMAADWALHREYLLAIWRARAVDPNSHSKWYRIERQPGPCWAERHLDAGRL